MEEHQRTVISSPRMHIQTKVCPGGHIYLYVGHACLFLRQDDFLELAQIVRATEHPSSNTTTALAVNTAIDVCRGRPHPCLRPRARSLLCPGPFRGLSSVRARLTGSGEGRGRQSHDARHTCQANAQVSLRLLLSMWCSRGRAAIRGVLGEAAIFKKTPMSRRTPIDIGEASLRFSVVSMVVGLLFLAQPPLQGVWKEEDMQDMHFWETTDELVTISVCPAGCVHLRVGRAIIKLTREEFFSLAGLSTHAAQEMKLADLPPARATEAGH